GDEREEVHADDRADPDRDVLRVADDAEHNRTEAGETELDADDDAVAPVGDRVVEGGVAARRPETDDGAGDGDQETDDAAEDQHRPQAGRGRVAPAEPGRGE